MSIKYTLCTACDDSYFPGLELMLRSLFKFNNFVGDIIVLDLGLSTNNKTLLDKYNIKYKGINEDNYTDILDFVHKHHGYYTQSFKTIDCHNLNLNHRVVYMDCDLIITGDIMELFNSNIFANGIWADKNRDFGFNKIFGPGFDRAVMILNPPYTSTKFYTKVIQNINKILEYSTTHINELYKLDIEDDACMFNIEVNQLPEKFCRLLDINRNLDKLKTKLIIETPLYKWWNNGDKLINQNKQNNVLESWININCVINSKKESDALIKYLNLIGLK